MFPFSEEAVEDIEEYLSENYVDNQVDQDSMTHEEAWFMQGCREGSVVLKEDDAE